MACLTGLGVILGGCGGPVEVDPPNLTGARERICTTLVNAVPQQVDGAERRDVEPPDAHAAAWGDPPIVLRCGVPMPEEFDEFATCQETNGVGWFIPDEQMTGEPTAITMTTIGRNVNVEVELPEDHWPPANAMVDLADAVKSSTTLEDPCV